MKLKINTLRINKNILKKSIFLVFVLLNLSQSLATTYTAIGCPGPVTWSGFTAGTCPFWNGSTQLTSQPAASDNLVIPFGCTVSVIGQPLTVDNTITIIVNGQLNFGNSNKLSLAPGSIVIVNSGASLNAGNGNGNNNYIDIGGINVWNATVGDIFGPFTLSAGCALISNNPNTYVPAGCGLAPLPIELIEFTSTCVTNGVKLNWSSGTEMNNDYFLIEKSDNAYDWEQIAKIKGFTNSYSINKYNHIDYTAKNNLTYYRISQVDMDGKKTMFKVIDAYCSKNEIKDQMILYPNPSSNGLNIMLNTTHSETNTSIILFDNVGQVIFETKVDLIKGVNSFSFPYEIPSGSYTVLFSSNNLVIPAQKLMVVKSF